MPMGNQGGGNVRVYPRVTGRFYAAFGASGVTAVVDRVFYCPLTIPDSRNIAAILSNVLTAGAGNARIGIYSDSNGQPGSLLFTVGTFSTNAIAVNSVAFNQTLSAGNYWIATQTDNATAAISQSLLASGNSVFDAIGQSVWGSNMAGYYQTAAYAGGLPATASGLTLAASTSIIGGGYTA